MEDEDEDDTSSVSHANDEADVLMNEDVDVEVNGVVHAI